MSRYYDVPNLRGLGRRFSELARPALLFGTLSAMPSIPQERPRPLFLWAVIGVLTVIALVFIPTAEPLYRGGELSDVRPFLLTLYAVIVGPMAWWSLRLTWLEKRYGLPVLHLNFNPEPGAQLSGEIHVNFGTRPERPASVRATLHSRRSRETVGVVTIPPEMMKPLRDGTYALPFAFTIAPGGYGNFDTLYFSGRIGAPGIGWAAVFRYEIVRR